MPTKTGRMLFSNFMMTEDQKLSCKKYSTLLGSCLVMSPTGVFWYLGNLNVYCMSYFVSVLDSTSGVDNSWLYSGYIVSWNSSLFISDLLAQRIGRRCVTLIGIFIFNAGLLSCYFSVQYSIWALAMTMGGMVGVGAGMIDGTVIKLALDWSGHDVGRITAILHASGCLGAVIITQFITRYTNPNNFSPNYYLNPTRYFTQTEVLDRVPSMFLVFGCCVICIQLTGFIMLRQKPTSKPTIPDPKDDDISETTSLIRHIDNWNSSTTNTAKEACEESSDIDVNVNVILIEDTTVPASKTTVTVQRRDFSYKDLFKMKVFYLLWIQYFLCGLPFVLYANYYKAFGQIWISDDYFISGISTVTNVANIGVSAFYGVSLDTFGVKHCYIAYMTSLSLVLFWYYFTAMYSRWLYFVVTLMFGSLSGCGYQTVIAAAAILFGKKHFTTNFGLIMSSQLIFNMIAPLFVGEILSHFGWFITYACSGAIVAICTIVICFVMPL